MEKKVDWKFVSSMYNSLHGTAYSARALKKVYGHSVGPIAVRVNSILADYDCCFTDWKEVANRVAREYKKYAVTPFMCKVAADIYPIIRKKK